MYFAHSTANSDRNDWQSLVDHLTKVAELAKERGSKFGAPGAAALGGLLHDLGKYSKEFQFYISGDGQSPDHSTAGAQEVLRLASSRPDKLVLHLLAYAIAGHHAGLPDFTGELDDRLKKQVPSLDSIWRDEITPDAMDLFPVSFQPHPDTSRHPFQFAFLGRMLFSCLIDADRRDTETFYAHVDGKTVDRDWPKLSENIDKLIAAFDAHMAEKRRELFEDDPVLATSDLNRQRDEILAHVREKAALTPGVFTLNVPTGGGKTLAALAFALDHAKAWKKQRIVVAIPFTSVIDQTAQVFRDVLGDDMVLEHHSAIEEETLGRWSGYDKRNGPYKLRLAMEDWAAPVVVTTNVQLFEGLFANRPSRCRKLHNLADTVIVLDEAQTIPLPVLRPCVAALDELARNYACTIVLCTATQPALMQPEFKGGLEHSLERELAPDPAYLHRALRRVTLERAGVMSDDDVVAALEAQEQGLVIVNSRAHALALYRAVRDAGLDGVVHLSTRQIAADRRRILAEVKQQLKNGAPCRLIATSLVEAGVDFDFPRVWRAEAGLDQIAQAAGRCNREGKRRVEESIVTTFQPAEAKPPREIAGFIGDMTRMAENYNANDLFSPEAVADYFQEVYWRKGEKSLDAHEVAHAFRMSLGQTSFAYRRIGEAFKLIESGMQPVIIAIDNAPKRTLAGLKEGWITPGRAAREFQTFIVQVPPKARKKLIDNGHARFVEGFGDQFAVLKTESLYTPEIGLLWEDGDYLGMENMMI
jgi:CRISPR-associated endonuclease/helicase Cas3